MLGAGCPRVTHPFAARAPSRRTGLARLACVKHAASVRPEPESNSPNKNNPSQRQVEFESEQSDLTKRHQKTGITKTGPHPHTGSAKHDPKKTTTKTKTTKHTIEFSNNNTRLTPASRQPCQLTRTSLRRQLPLPSQFLGPARLADRLPYTRSISAPSRARFSTNSGYPRSMWKTS